MILSRLVTRPILRLAASFLPALVLAAASPVAASVLTWQEVQRRGVNGLDGVDGLAVSPDGANLYAASYNDNALAVFTRDPVTGGLTFFELQENGVSGVQGLGGARGVTVSP